MKPAFAYYGGKTRYARWIVNHLPAHRVYLEPFAGSAAVLFAKPPVSHEILNDVDAQVVNFYRLLRDRHEDLRRVCELTPYARDEYDLADFDAPDIDDLERARRWWARSTQGFGQSATVSTGWSISTAQRSPRTHQIAGRLARFDQLTVRLRNVVIENTDALELIARYGSDPSAALYLDPPYFEDTRSAPSCYRHEFQTAEDHRSLAAMATECKAAVIVSGYHDPLYDELFDGWFTDERTVVRRAGNGRTQRLDNAVEVLWSNRPLATVEQPALAFGASP